MAQKKTRKTRKSGTDESRDTAVIRAPRRLLVSNTIRKKVRAIVVCVDVSLEADQLSKLRDMCGGDGFFGASLDDDEETALFMKSLKGPKIHVTVEFRRGGSSPYDRIPKKEFRKLVQVLSQGEMELVYASRSQLVRWPDGVAPPPLTVEDRNTRVTGLEVEHGEDGLEGSKLEFLADRIIITRWSKHQVPVRSLADALNLGWKGTKDGP